MSGSTGVVPEGFEELAAVKLPVAVPVLCAIVEGLVGRFGPGIVLIQRGGYACFDRPLPRAGGAGGLENGPGRGGGDGGDSGGAGREPRLNGKNPPDGGAGGPDGPDGTAAQVAGRGIPQAAAGGSSASRTRTGPGREGACIHAARPRAGTGTAVSSGA